MIETRHHRALLFVSVISVFEHWILSRIVEIRTSDFFRERALRGQLVVR